MAAINPAGSEKYWFEGLPSEILKKEDEGTERYWFEGLPGESLIPIIVVVEFVKDLIQEGIVAFPR